MAPPNSDNFDTDFIQNVLDEGTANLLTFAELPFHFVSRESILPEFYAPLPPAAPADHVTSADRATSPPSAMLLVNNPLFPRRAADGLPTHGFKETSEEEVLLLSGERRAQMDAIVTDFPSWFMDPSQHNNYANSISNNPYVGKLSFTDNLEVIFQEAPLTFQGMYGGLLRAADLWTASTKRKYSRRPDDPGELAQAQDDALRAQTFYGFIHATNICQAALFDKMKRQLGNLWHANMEENTMDQILQRQHNGLKYAFSPAQQVAWSMDFTANYRDRMNALELLMTDLDTFKRGCVDLKNTQEANADRKSVGRERV